MWRQYAGYERLERAPEPVGERLARERGVSSWPNRRVINVEHARYTPERQMRMRINGRIPAPATCKTIEMLECGHTQETLGRYFQNMPDGSILPREFEPAERRRCRPCAVARFTEEANWAAETGRPIP